MTQDINDFMEPGKDKGERKEPGRHEHPLPQEISSRQKQQAADAHDAAEKDMERDAEISAHSPNDDLDEGEMARLGEDTTDII